MPLVGDDFDKLNCYQTRQLYYSVAFTSDLFLCRHAERRIYMLKFNKNYIFLFNLLVKWHARMCMYAYTHACTYACVYVHTIACLCYQGRRKAPFRCNFPILAPRFLIHYSAICPKRRPNVKFFFGH